MKKKLLTLLAVSSVAVVCWAIVAPSTVTMDGVTITTRAKVIGGETWIPVADLAKAKNLQITKTALSIDLSVSGGANQVGGTTGKIGQMLNTGRWRFQVNSFKLVSEYKVKHKTSTDYGVYAGVSEYDNDVFTAKPEFDLFVASCTLKNARTDSQQFDWNPTDNKTSIADSDGSNHPWLVYDIPSPAFVSSAILPGSKLDFNVCFAVKKGVKPSELVFMLKSLVDDKPEIVRISTGN